MNAASRPELEYSPTSPVATAHRLIRFAVERADQLGGDLFANPAWSILLNVFIATELDRRATIESVAVAANLTESSAARWLNVLVQRGLLEIVESADGDRPLVRTTESGRRRLGGFLGDWQ
jgi:DNA-binding MarR family transcriptional regulator